MGAFIWAAVARPLSPVLPVVPVPTTVLITPVVAFTNRIRLPAWSTMYKLPAASTAPCCGARMTADVAGPPSPADAAPLLHVPAKTPIVQNGQPVALEMLRTTFADVSKTYSTLRALSKARPRGWLNPAALAGPPFPKQGSVTLPVMRVSHPDALTCDMCPAPVKLKLATCCAKK